VAVDNGTFGTVKDKLMKAHDVAAARAEQPGAAGGAAVPAGDGRGYQTRLFLKIRRAYTDLLTATKRKNIIHGLVEIGGRQ
jgi:hypothetical protein